MTRNLSVTRVWLAQIGADAIAIIQQGEIPVDELAKRLEYSVKTVEKALTLYRHEIYTVSNGRDYPKSFCMRQR